MLLMATGIFYIIRNRTAETHNHSAVSGNNAGQTKRHLDRPPQLDASGDTNPTGNPPVPGTGGLQDGRPIPRSSEVRRGPERPEHWKSSVPSNVALLPPGAAVTPPEVAVTVDGRRHLPRFQGSFSDRMEISREGHAAFSVAWPPEHNTEEILVSTINDGRINGQPGAVLKRGSEGRFRFNFQAGPHPGATQVILTAATLSYTLNFWVPTGNPNVDPPALR